MDTFVYSSFKFFRLINLKRAQPPKIIFFFLSYKRMEKMENKIRLFPSFFPWFPVWTSLESQSAGLGS